ncbi:hypothetical protein [uncultured Winogradskyella sp.]|uniref:hypothetical protein n=1 Tax=uncultured Winogradskyella sp. TaxID=395353 RepID=UPI002639A12D|nr:hypothetical protein [uncultured Winogradskyella sp.]
MKYYKRNWEDTRGDDFDDWGKSIWLFETDNHGKPVRQIEIYENGKVLKYNEDLTQDKYGGLGDQELDLDDFNKFKITEQEFINYWNQY